MNAEDAYQWLIGASTTTPHDAFDVHVVAAIFALALAEARESGGVAEGVGLEKPTYLELACDFFPGAAGALDQAFGAHGIVVDEEEQSLRDILAMHATGNSRLQAPLGAMISRRCRWPHHLWQDLGLRNRGELSLLMQRHFAGLARKNRQDMKWKKFLYRMVCGSEGFTLCTAPVCSDCDDFNTCFGTEDGESRLARQRNTQSAAA